MVNLFIRFGTNTKSAKANKIALALFYKIMIEPLKIGLAYNRIHLVED